MRAYAVGDSPAYNPIVYSHHCAGYTDLGSKEGVVERWLDWLAESAPRGAVLLPCNDEGLDLIVCHRATLEGLGYVPVEADDEVLAAMLDKEKTYELARRACVPTPRTWTHRKRRRPRHLDRGDRLPLRAEALHTHLFARVSGSATSCWSRMTAASWKRGLAGWMHSSVASRSPTSPFYKLRQYPPHFGLGCYVVSDWDQAAIDAGLRFLRGVGLRGLFHVEFKRDPRDGVLKLLECNHRFTIEAMFAPIDLPLLTYNRLLGRPLPPARSYRSGIHLWNPVQDFRAFRSYRRRGELTFGRWLWSLLLRKRFHAFRWDDPLPTIRHHLDWLARGLRRLLFGRRQAREKDPLLATGR